MINYADDEEDDDDGSGEWAKHVKETIVKFARRCCQCKQQRRLPNRIVHELRTPLMTRVLGSIKLPFLPLHEH